MAGGEGIPPYWRLAVQRQQAVERFQHLDRVREAVQGEASYAEKRAIVESITANGAAEFGIGTNAARDFAVAVADDIVGLGALETLVRDETVYNITIRWFDGMEPEVILHRIGSVAKDRFFHPFGSLAAFREGIIGNRAIRLSGQPVNWNYSSPHITLYLPSHKARIAANMLHDNKSILVSVRINRTGQPDLDELRRMGMVPTLGMFRFLKAMLAARANFLVVGSTGSGKTTLLRALLHSVSFDDILYVVEDSPELDLDERSDRHSMILPLVPTRERGVSALVRDSQRYMADRIVIGEALDESIIDWFTVANVTGGSGLTLHAEEPSSVFRRVRNMCGSKLSEREVFERMAESVDLVVFVRRRFNRDPERQIENVWALSHQTGSDGKPQYAELWAYDRDGGLAWRNVIPEPLQDKLSPTGVRLVANERDAIFARVPGTPLDPLLADITEDAAGSSPATFGDRSPQQPPQADIGLLGEIFGRRGS